MHPHEYVVPIGRALPDTGEGAALGSGPLRRSSYAATQQSVSPPVERSGLLSRCRLGLRRTEEAGIPLVLVY